MRKTIQANGRVKHTRLPRRGRTEIGFRFRFSTLCLVASLGFANAQSQGNAQSQDGVQVQGNTQTHSDGNALSQSRAPSLTKAPSQPDTPSQPTPPQTPLPSTNNQPLPNLAKDAQRHLDAIVAHMQYVTEHSYDQEGDSITPMWLATIDLKTNGLPDPRLPLQLRWSELATAPSGASLFWDQPTLVAAHELSQRTGCKCYTDASEAYVQAYFDACVDQETGMIWWGSEHYYDVARDAKAGPQDKTILVVRTPAWQTLWKVDRSIVERQIRSMSEIRDLHADSAIEPEWVLIESLSWLAEKDVADSQTLRDQASSIARQRFSVRHPKTSLIPTSMLLPPGIRPVEIMDAQSHETTSTAALGRWISSLLFAGQRNKQSDLIEIADAITSRWLAYGYDSSKGRYFHSVSTNSGLPISGAETDLHVRMLQPSRAIASEDVAAKATPGLAMIQDNPWPMAEACLTLFELTGKPIYREATEHWIHQFKAGYENLKGEAAYAESFGRAIHFLARAASILKQPDHRQLAERVAEDAMTQFYAPKLGMFRSHPGADRCDSVDGIGYLLLALLYLEGPVTSAANVFHF